MWFKILNLCFLFLLLITTSSGGWQKYNGRNKSTRECTCSCTSTNCNGNGDGDITTTTTTTTKKPPILRPVPNEDPCEPFIPPPQPAFIKQPGRRISVNKCYEYMWQMKVRKDKADREKQCKDKGNTIHFVIPGDSSHTLFKRDATNDETEKDITSPEGPTNKKHTLYILGGHDARPMEFPHMGAVGWRSVTDIPKWKFMCGSTLISPNFALTAAHCTSADSRDTTIADVVPKVVRFGVEDIIFSSIKHPPIDREISKIIKHPKYDSPKKYFDLALLQFDEPIKFTKYVQPACLWQKDVDHLSETTVTGWGVTSPGAHEGHPFLQAADLDVIDTSTCSDLLKPICSRLWCGLQVHQFCAGQLRGGVDACQGDSGGPLQKKISLPDELRSEGNLHYVIGVTSFGIGCGKKDIPGIYTKVSHFVDWIESVVWPDKN